MNGDLEMKTILMILLGMVGITTSAMAATNEVCVISTSSTTQTVNVYCTVPSDNLSLFYGALGEETAKATLIKAIRFKGYKPQADGSYIK